MSCDSGIYTVNTGVSFQAGGIVPLGAIIRRFGCGAQLNGNGITVDKAGYYDVDVALTVLPTAAGAITATLMKDGVAVPGATATGTATAVGSAVPLAFGAMVRQFNNCSGSTYTIILSGAATVSNVAVSVEKI